MGTSSPMLERVRRGYRKTDTSNPKKKNLLFLAIFLFVLSALFFWNISRGKNSHSDEISPDSESTTSTDKHGLTGNKKKHKKFKLKSFSSSSLKKYFKTNSPDFNKSKEKIRLNNNNYMFYYSIDTSLQRYGEKLFNRYRPKYGAIAASIPSTGQIISLVSYTDDSSAFIDSMLFLKSIFPAASLFKIVTAAAAIEKKSINPENKILTAGRNHTLYKYQLKNKPDNYRMITLENAFAYSINPAFGYLGMHILKSDILKEYCAKFGFNSEVPFILDNDKPGTTVSDSGYAIAELSSGFNKKTLISPLFGVLLASSIANRGTIKKPLLIDSIISVDNNKRIYEGTRGIWKKPVRASTAEKLSEIMNAVARYGTARSSFKYIKRSFRFKDIAYGGKTGSIDKDGLGKIDWFVGFARHNEDKEQQIAVSVVTVHGPKWTVHSSFIGAEIIRKRIRNIQLAQLAEKKVDSTGTKNSKDDI